MPGHVIVAPDSFKGTFSAAQVAAAMAAGAADAGRRAVECPLADGGEGTVAVLAAALGGQLRPCVVAGSWGDPVDATFLVSADGRTAAVEAAAANGLHLDGGAGLGSDSRAERADTYGTGQLLAAAAASGAQMILLGVGGSATTDGGAGAVRGLHENGGLRGARLTVLCDVATAFEDAAVVFGPQKGAGPAAVARLTRRLDELAATYARDPRGVPRTGCAGGLSGGLWAQSGAELVSGIDAVLATVGFERLLTGAAAVITGEGRLDAQTRHGKVVSGVLRAARALDVPVFAVVGQNELSVTEALRLGLAGVDVGRTLPEIRSAAGSAAAALDH